MRRALTGAVAATVCAVSGAADSRSTGLQLQPCDHGSRVLCGTVLAPLDPAGAVVGTVRLHVEELPAPRPRPGSAAPAMFLVAGGPGQASAGSFELGKEGPTLERAFPGYTLVAYDDRGTGRSQPIGCPSLATASFDRVGACGRRLGRAAPFYSTQANAADLDAVRVALGLDRISLYGVSYGTRQAVTYATEHASHVDAMILDSESPLGRSLLDLAPLKALPRALDQICRHGCSGVTTHAGSDFVRLANRLHTSPVTVLVKRPGAAPANVRLGGYTLIDLGVGLDLDTGLAAELPTAVSSGLAGDYKPLGRLEALASSPAAALGINEAVDVATRCNDVFDSLAGGTEAQRTAALPALTRSLFSRSSSLGAPFGSWAIPTFSGFAACGGWPFGAATKRLPHSALPGTRVLVLSGSLDVRTPTAPARRVAAGFAHGRILVVQGVGHSVLSRSTCAQGYVAAWLEQKPHAACPPAPTSLEPVGPLPAPSIVAGKLTPQGTLAVVRVTVRDAEAVVIAYDRPRVAIAGLASGVIRVGPGPHFRLVRYSDGSGVTISGAVSRLHHRWSATLSVAGSDAAGGKLTIAGGRLTGMLGGRRVGTSANSG